MAYLTIIAMGGFGLLIAGVSHYFVSRERREILEAQARKGEVEIERQAFRDKPLETVAGLALTQGGRRAPSNVMQASRKQYSKRIQGK
jgi:hypothetical protein